MVSRSGLQLIKAGAACLIGVGSLLWLDAAHAQSREATTEAIGQSRETAITRAIEKASPAVGGINATQIREFSRSPLARDPLWSLFFASPIYRQRVQSLGSGFLIDSDGHFLTNSHVVEDAEEIVVTLSDGKEYSAEIVGIDKVSDVALLRLEGRNFPHLEIGNSDDVVIGEWVIALGNPFGLFDMSKKPTATVGVVSGVDLDFGQQANGRIYQDMIQTDASINAGNSGGPLINALGEVVGVNTFIFTGSRFSEGSIGISFAIPINRAKSVAEDLKKYGMVDRTFWTGLTVQNVNRLLARHLNLKMTRGVIVTGVERDSPAEKAGLQIGDIVVAVSGEQVLEDDDIFRIIEENFLGAGDSLEITVRRSERKKTLRLLLEKPAR